MFWKVASEMCIEGKYIRSPEMYSRSRFFSHTHPINHSVCHTCTTSFRTILFWLYMEQLGFHTISKSTKLPQTDHFSSALVASWTLSFKDDMIRFCHLANLISIRTDYQSIAHNDTNMRRHNGPSPRVTSNALFKSALQLMQSFLSR